jgi:hypothetical protein
MPDMRGFVLLVGQERCTRREARGPDKADPHIVCPPLSQKASCDRSTALIQFDPL